MRKLHEGEVDIGPDLVARLVSEQFPRFANLAIRAVESTGTVNAIYRLGDRLCIRLPRLRKYAEGLKCELRWLPKLAPHLSLRVPEPIATGHAGSGYPFVWAIYSWIDGDAYRDDLVRDEREAAETLARFVLELRRVSPLAAPQGGRQPLRDLDAVTRAAIASSGDAVETGPLTDAWESALEAPEWNGTPVRIHSDLLRPNLIVDGGRLRGVIDFGSAGAGDPAADVVPAWSVFGPVGRAAIRSALEVDDGTWHRARGYALHQAALIIPYYADSNPEFVALAQRTVSEVLADMND